MNLLRLFFIFATCVSVLSAVQCSEAASIDALKENEDEFFGNKRELFMSYKYNRARRLHEVNEWMLRELDMSSTAYKSGGKGKGKGNRARRLREVDEWSDLDMSNKYKSGGGKGKGHKKQ